MSSGSIPPRPDETAPLADPTWSEALRRATRSGPTGRRTAGAAAALAMLVAVVATTVDGPATSPTSSLGMATASEDDPATSTDELARPPRRLPSPSPSTSATSRGPTPAPTTSDPTTIGPATPTVTPAPSPTETAAPTPIHAPTTAAPSTVPDVTARGDDAATVASGVVTRVVDGDTLDLDDGTRVRLAIVDTPEVNGSREACGPEAADLTQQMVGGRTVRVLRPADAPPTDTFGRTLGEVVLADEPTRSLNVALVAAGLGTVDERFTHEDPDLAARARAAGQQATPPSCAAPPPTEEAPPPPPGHGGNTTGGWSCHPAYFECLPVGPDLDCKDVGHEVRLVGDDDPYRLDGRSTTREDGIGCESKDPWRSGVTYPYY